MPHLCIYAFACTHRCAAIDRSMITINHHPAPASPCHFIDRSEDGL
jgi:hypothetical protein